VKKYPYGKAGILVAVTVALVIALTSKTSPVRTYVGLDGALIVLLLGFVATVRGSWLWLILCAIGIAEMALIVF
jgi:hypothetical protein